MRPAQSRFSGIELALKVHMKAAKELRSQRGFTLIELLIVVAIIGVVAAIAIPNMLNAIDRSRQKRSLADMRTLATVLEEYSIDKNYYPIQATQAAIGPSISPLLDPMLTRTVPPYDGWNRDFQYGTSANGSGYTLRSLGKDGILNGTPGQTSDFNCDIVVQMGMFTAWPEGLQT